MLLIVFTLAIALRGVWPAPAIQAEQAAAPAERGHFTRHSHGKAIFRFDAFGDEQLWTDVLRMHEVLPTVDPATALAVGLKVDVDALPARVVEALKAGEVDLTDPAVTVLLLRLNAVVGVKGTVRSRRAASPRSASTCALCHSSVDDATRAGHWEAARRVGPTRDLTSARSSRSHGVGRRRRRRNSGCGGLASTTPGTTRSTGPTSFR
jgi:hypothetical protein